MISNQMKNLLIGIFVLSSIFIITFMILFLRPYVGDEGQIIRVRFVDIDKVNVGTRVTFAGKPIGEVIAIHELPEAREGRKEQKGEIYVYELDLAINRAVVIYNSDMISLRTSGLLGEKSISIDPEPPIPGVPLRVVNDEVIYAKGVGSVEETFQEFKDAADRLDRVLDSVNEALEELQEKKFWENIANIADGLSEVVGNLLESWGDVKDSIANFAETSADIRDIAEKVKSGEGTVGKLLETEDFYLRLSSLLSKGETILDDVNHYGILFHLDKGWQRLRARRMNLLQKLRSPQEFRNFFNDELDQISTSLSRVSTFLEMSQSSKCYPVLIEDRGFQKVFAEFMRKTKGMEEALRMYNTQLNDYKVKQTELGSATN